MTISLVYHPLDNHMCTSSPFDKAITNIVRGQTICIACPYLNLDYLIRITDMSASWRMLTDVEEWLKLHEASARPDIQQFIEIHQQAIHHIKDLHAKVILARHQALVGSANFTRKGITGRTEMSIWFEDEPHIAELHEWFETLWAQSAPVEITDLQAFVGTLPHQSRASLGAKNGLPCRARPINSKLVSDKKPSLAVQETEAHLLLIQRVKQTPGREWMDCYFDLMKRVIEATGLTNDDRRLVTSIPKTSGEYLPMSINNRWVLGAFQKHGEWGIRIIYGPEFAFLPELPTNVIRHIRFNPLRGEGFDTPFLLSFKDIDAVLSGTWDAGWLSAAKAEIVRAQASPYRKYHQSVVYEAAINPTYRTQVFNAAFGEH